MKARPVLTQTMLSVPHVPLWYKIFSNLYNSFLLPPAKLECKGDTTHEQLQEQYCCQLSTIVNEHLDYSSFRMFMSALISNVYLLLFIAIVLHWLLIINLQVPLFRDSHGRCLQPGHTMHQVVMVIIYWCN